MLRFPRLRAAFPAARSLIAGARASSTATSVFAPTDAFLHRHVGPSEAETSDMLRTLKYDSVDQLVDDAVPAAIRLDKPLAMEPALSESEALAKLKGIMGKNKVLKSLIGMGYYETHTPGVVLRNILENPGWYTSYTPYQAEISQGRLQMLLSFQTMVADLTGMEMSNASLLDESTAAAEAMSMCYALKQQKKPSFFVDQGCHPQNIALARTRGEALGMNVVVGAAEEANFEGGEFCGAMVQYPNTFGAATDWTSFTAKAKSAGVLTVAVTDLLALVMLKPPGEMGFDVAVGSAQRFGVPMGFGGPHAAFMATSTQHSRKMPGRVIGVSRDSRGQPALRMAMQTREQHIRRDKATSNICTAQALLANMAAAYGVYHGPDGLRAIASRVHNMARVTAEALAASGMAVELPAGSSSFDTFVVDVSGAGMTAEAARATCAAAGVNVRVVDASRIGLAFGETLTRGDVEGLLGALGAAGGALEAAEARVVASGEASGIAPELRRTTPFMTHAVFNSYHSETLMLRYLRKLEGKDLALNHSMISLGSCTMKLNATSEMAPVTWPETCALHPFAPADQWEGYREMIESLNRDLAEITGFAAVSAQPNSGAQGEYAGLLCIRNYHKARGEDHRNVCLIPVSAHGTNPASAVMAGYRVVVVKSDAMGNVDMDDLRAKAEQHSDKLGALMITYPSTYGVFETGVKDICSLVHGHGGLVYMDGANMNAQVGLTSPGAIGADVCHLNLHKTFCIPHGGGGPGVGSIGVNARLAPYLPGHPVVPVGGEGAGVEPKEDGAVSAAPFGSSAILPISWMYIKMLGEPGLRNATSMAIVNANYMAKRLEPHFDILYRGEKGLVAHEFIVDLRPFKEHGIVEEDVAKRLQDYGFHSPTMSWPVGGTIMVEPTESEDKAEMDRFVEALVAIRGEIEDVVQGRFAPQDSPLKNAPHTMDMVMGETWDRKYSREVAAFPAPWVGDAKFWPTVGRVDNVYGDRNLICSCAGLETYMDEPSSPEQAAA